MFAYATGMEFIKRLLGYHKTPPVLVDACLFELNCIIMQVTPKHGRRVIHFLYVYQVAV